jgi:hypothetical protein
MRRHGWELPYHPLQVNLPGHISLLLLSISISTSISTSLSISCSLLHSHPFPLHFLVVLWFSPLQVVAIAVFLALGFAFFVFFLPFVGSHVMEIVVSSVYAPLVRNLFSVSLLFCKPCEP